MKREVAAPLVLLTAICAITSSLAENRDNAQSPATSRSSTASADLNRAQQEKRQAEREHADEHDFEQASRTWARTAQRQAGAAKLLSARTGKKTSRPTIADQDLAKILRNPNTAEATGKTLADVLTLRQQMTGNEPQVATFELPIHYRSMTNLGELLLLVDPVENDAGDQCKAVKFECKEAPNGNSLLVWQTGFDAPGKHALQAVLTFEARDGERRAPIEGPFLSFISSNICQYSESSAHFDPELGATLMAKLPEPNARYRVEFISVAGETIRTLKGETTDGIIKAYWDLNDDHGRRFTGDAFDSVFHITLTDSGRSQTQPGP